MKHNNNYYMQLSRHICDEEHKEKLSIGARMLFVTLNELEQRYCNEGKTFFVRSNEQLAEDMGVSINSIKKYKAELRKNATDLVKMGIGRYKDKKTGKMSEEYITTYSILR